MKEFEHDGHTYRVGTINALGQFHLARRIAPIQLALGLSFTDASGGLKTGDDLMATFMGMLQPIIETVSKMPQADVDYVLNACLAVTARKQGESWAPMLASNGQLMFADLKMQGLTRICIEVIRENLGDFFGQGSGGIA